MELRNKLDLGLAIYAIAVLGASLVSFASAFLKAYASGNKRVLMQIDQYGEANLEFVLLMIGIFAVLWTSMNVFNYLRCPDTK